MVGYQNTGREYPGSNKYQKQIFISFYKVNIYFEEKKISHLHPSFSSLLFTFSIRIFVLH